MPNPIQNVRNDTAHAEGAIMFFSGDDLGASRGCRLLQPGVAQFCGTRRVPQDGFML
jgi:hypothetical protein